MSEAQKTTAYENEAQPEQQATTSGKATDAAESGGNQQLNICPGSGEDYVVDTTYPRSIEGMLKIATVVSPYYTLS